MNVFQIAIKLIPAIRKAAKAMRKDSPGGKKVTKKEREDIAATLAGEILAVIEEL